MAQQHQLIADKALALALAAIEQSDYQPGVQAIPHLQAAYPPGLKRGADRQPHPSGLSRFRQGSTRAPLLESRALGVRRMVVLGVYQGNWQRVWDLVLSDPDLHAAFGLHPVYLDDHQPDDLRELGEWLTRLAGHRQLCAVGEIGLDYFIETLDRERQQALFDAQLQLAADFNLPALIHVRRSHAAVIATLKRFRPSHARASSTPSPAARKRRANTSSSVTSSAWAAPRPGPKRCACTVSSPSCR